MAFVSSTVSIQKPSKPVKTEAPNATKIFLHEGEDVDQYNSFIQVVSDLAQAFKFLPKYDQLNYKHGVPNASTNPSITAEYDAALLEFDWSNDEIFGNFSKQAEPGSETKIWGEGLGKAFSNLEFSPDASDWDLLEGVNSGSSSILDEITSNFNWGSINSTIAGKSEGLSFYQIAKSGAIADYTDEQAFDLMCLMAESKERVFSVLYKIFGDPSKLGANEDLIGLGGVQEPNGVDDVIDHITDWLSQYTEVDPHNLGVLKMFFGMQTDFINTLDAYMNCETYWGGDLTNPVYSDDLGDFSEILTSKVESYILSPSLSGDQKAAAESLEATWFLEAPRYDEVGDKWTGDLTPAKEVSNCQLAVNAAQAAYDSCAQTVYDKALAAYDIAVAASADLTNVTNNLNAASDNLVIANQTDANASLTEQDTLLATLQDAQNALKDAKAINADFEINASRSWVEFFQDRMDEFGTKEVVRVVTCNMFNRSANQKYTKEKAQYEEKKDDAIQQDIFLQRMQAKSIAANKQTFRKNVARSANFSKAIRAKAPAGAGRARPSAFRVVFSRSAGSPAVRYASRSSMRSASGTTPKHLAAGGAAKRAPSRIAGGQGIKRSAAVGSRAVAPVRPKAASPALRPQAQTHAKDDKKVI